MCESCDWRRWLELAERMHDDDRYEFAWSRLQKIMGRVSLNGHIESHDLSALLNIEAKANPTAEDREDLIRGEEPPEE